MLELLLAIVAALCPDSAADGLRSTAPTYLTAESARENWAAATIAGVSYSVDRDLLLSIAHHESRYQHRTVTRERGCLVSCGVMTPEPTTRARCAAARTSVLSGYLAGARHLRGWLDACHGRETCALLGYAGGFALIRECSAGARLRGCGAPGVFRWRAGLIRRRADPDRASGG